MTKIGVFDSGFGGLAIHKELCTLLPEYDYIYLGDTERVPYGTRSKETIFRFCLEAVEFLFESGCDLIVFACNTASADALRRIQQEVLPGRYPSKRVLGVIIPACEEAIAKSSGLKIGVMATEASVKSEAFLREIRKISPMATIFQVACPLLVPIVEADEIESEITDIMLRKYLSPDFVAKIDTLILGCTHYGHLESKIRHVIGEEIAIISEGSVVAEKLKTYLGKHKEIESKLGRNSLRIFCTTDHSDKFDRIAAKLFGEKVKAEKVVISN
jgi:glutamate racemase